MIFKKLLFFSTHLAVLFSIPVYRWNLNRPERVPKNAVSTPSSILTKREREREKMETEKDGSAADKEGHDK